MSIRIGIYDFFAYTIPGGLVLLILLCGLDSFGVQGVWEKLNNLTTPQIFLLIIICYLMGFVFNPFFTKWGGFFESKNIEQDILEVIKKRNAALSIEINPNDWAIWLAAIRRENLDLAFEIDRFMAIAKMLRGISVFLLLGGILILTNVISGKYPIWYLSGTVISLVLSVVVVHESIQSKKRFFYVIFETVISRQNPFAYPPISDKDKPQSGNQAKKEK